MYHLKMKFREIFVLVCFMFNGVSSNNSTAVLKKLYKDLLVDYETRLRPITDQHQRIDVYTYHIPTTVLELDIELQRLTLSAHFGFYWTDEFLRWNLSESDGIDTLWFPVSQVWHPTPILSLSYSGIINVGNSDDLVAVANNGSVSWETAGVFQLVCQVDIEFYPFDTQECGCHLYISDLPQDKVLLLLLEDGMYRNGIFENPVWHILDMKAESVDMYERRLLRYKFLFRRRAAFAMYTTIGPLIILAFLNTAAFLVPIDSGEKGSIVMTLILSFCVYNSSTSMYLPPNSIQNSNLLVFMTILEANSAVAVLYTMVQSYLYSNGGISPKVLRFLKFMKSCSRPKTDVMELTVKPTYQVDTTDAENMPTLPKNRYRGIDVFMFCVFLLTNLVVIGVFVSKVQSNFRETL